jgi:hypothetical protein
MGASAVGRVRKNSVFTSEVRKSRNAITRDPPRRSPIADQLTSVSIGSPRKRSRSASVGRRRP